MRLPGPVSQCMLPGRCGEVLHRIALDFGAVGHCCSPPTTCATAGICPKADTGSARPQSGPKHGQTTLAAHPGSGATASDGAPQQLDLVGLLPRRLNVGAPKMPERGGGLENRATQV